MHARTLAQASLATLAAAAGAAAQGSTLHVIDALSWPSTIPEAYLSDVNDHGRAVGFMTYTELVGGGASTSYKAFDWTAARGVEVFLDHGSFAAVNNGGDVVVGDAGLLWSDGASFGVGPLPGDRRARVFDLNDARTAVGYSITRQASSCSIIREAIVWTEATGTLGLERDYGVAGADLIHAINAHGQVAGAISHTSSCIDFEAFTYDPNTGSLTNLHDMLGATTSEALAISDSGLVVGKNGSTGPAWLWEPGVGFAFLPALPGADAGDVRPTDVTDDGRVVGAATNAQGLNEAFLWSARDGMRTLADLADVPDDFEQTYAAAINEGGVIVGTAQLTRTPVGGVSGFKAWALETGSACRADLDGDGALTIFDFLEFQNLFDAGDPLADFDGDGDLTIFDFLAFQNEFDAGCA